MVYCVVVAFVCPVGVVWVWCVVVCLLSVCVVLVLMVCVSVFCLPEISVVSSEEFLLNDTADAQHNTHSMRITRATLA